MAKYYTYKQNVRLGPNQSLHYKPGRGYYAGPRIYQKGVNYFKPGDAYTGSGVSFVSPGHAPGVGHGGTGVGPYTTVRAPKKPVDPYGPLSASAVNARATAQANQALLPQQQEIRRQQDLARRQAEQRYATIRGESEAEAKMLGEMAPAVSQGYSTATQDIGALSQGMSEGIRSDLTEQQAQDEAFAKSQGQAAGPGEVSAGGLGDVTQALGGLFPGQSMAARGAAATAAAAAAPQISLAAGAQELKAAMTAAQQANDDYAQQLISLAAQFPGLKAQALQALNQYEMDKANYREQVRMNNKNYALQLRAEMASEISAGLEAGTAADKLQAAKDKTDREFTYKYAQLNFKKKQDADKAALSKKTIDVQASRALGHVVYKDGSEDPSIPVQKFRGPGSSGSGGAAHTKALAARGKAVTQANKDAASQAAKLLGKPLKSTGQYAQGAYRAQPGKSEFGDGTTNDKRKAMREGAASSYGDAFAKIWAYIAGDQLMARYGLSRRQVEGYIVRQMARVGWPPVPNYHGKH